MSIIDDLASYDLEVTENEEVFKFFCSLSVLLEPLGIVTSMTNISFHDLVRSVQAEVAPGNAKLKESDLFPMINRLVLVSLENLESFVEVTMSTKAVRTYFSKAAVSLTHMVVLAVVDVIIAVSKINIQIICESITIVGDLGTLLNSVE